MPLFQQRHNKYSGACLVVTPHFMEVRFVYFPIVWKHFNLASYWEIVFANCYWVELDEVMESHKNAWEYRICGRKIHTNFYVAYMSVNWVNVLKKTKARGFELVTKAKATKMRFQTVKRKKHTRRDHHFFFKCHHEFEIITACHIVVI